MLKPAQTVVLLLASVLGLARAAASERKAAGDESIYVVQPRAYSKSHRLEVTPELFTSLNNRFVGHMGPALSVAYHVRENVAFELNGGWPAYKYYSAFVRDVYRYEFLGPQAVELKLVAWFAAASLQFSALYGKLDFYSTPMDYDFYVTTGFGVASTLETCEPGQSRCGPDVGIGRGLRSPRRPADRYKLAGNFGGGARFFFSRRLGLRLEVRDMVYADRAVQDGQRSTDVRNNVWLFVGLAVLMDRF